MDALTQSLTSGRQFLGEGCQSTSAPCAARRVNDFELPHLQNASSQSFCRVSHQFKNEKGHGEQTQVVSVRKLCLDAYLANVPCA
jgi:hypothetical protein